MLEILNPEARQLPGCSGDPVQLSDGKEWLIRRPERVWVPDDDEDGFTDAFTLGPEFDALWADLVKREETLGVNGDDLDANIAAWKGWKGAQFRIFRALLACNYRLDTDDLKALLRLDFSPDIEGQSESDGKRIYNALWAIATGQSVPGKPLPGGSDSPG